ncbi:MAG TPA: hypothetical protein HA346_01490 [Thermoplasmata archaeon]|nr:hypothetical protein [Thermoplasmata archaeon]
MFRRSRRGAKAKGKYLTPEEIREKLEELKGKIPFFVLDELSNELKDKELTKEQFKSIVSEVAERVEQSRVDKKVENVFEQLTKISSGIESMGKLTRERPSEGVSLEEIEKLEVKVDDLLKKTGDFSANNKSLVEDLRDHLAKIEKSTGSLSEIPTERLERVERETSALLSRMEDLSKDLHIVFGQADVRELVHLGLKGKLA